MRWWDWSLILNPHHLPGRSPTGWNNAASASGTGTASVLERAGVYGDFARALWWRRVSGGGMLGAVRERVYITIAIGFLAYRWRQETGHLRAGCCMPGGLVTHAKKHVAGDIFLDVNMGDLVKMRKAC